MHTIVKFDEDTREMFRGFLCEIRNSIQHTYALQLLVVSGTIPSGTSLTEIHDMVDALVTESGMFD